MGRNSPALIGLVTGKATAAVCAEALKERAAEIDFTIPRRVEGLRDSLLISKREQVGQLKLVGRLGTAPDRNSDK